MALYSQSQPVFICDSDSDRISNQSLFPQNSLIFVIATGQLHCYTGSSNYVPIGEAGLNINFNQPSTTTTMSLVSYQSTVVCGTFFIPSGITLQLNTGSILQIL